MLCNVKIVVLANLKTPNQLINISKHPQIELKRKLFALESFFDDVPAPELILALVPAEVSKLCFL